MELDIQERFAILNLLANSEGDITLLRAVREMQGKVAPSADEREKFKIKQDATQVKWDPEAKTETEIDLSGSEKSIIVEKLQTLDREKRLTEQTFSIYEKFVEN